MAKKKSLPNEYRDEAEKLATLPYAVLVVREQDDNGNPYFLAVNPELNGCMAHGSTSEEAIESLKEARTDYIQVLIMSGQPLPNTSAMEEVYTEQTGTVPYVKTFDASQKHEVLTAVPNGGELIADYTFRFIPTNNQ